MTHKAPIFETVVSPLVTALVWLNHLYIGEPVAWEMWFVWSYTLLQIVCLVGLWTCHAMIVRISRKPNTMRVLIAILLLTLAAPVQAEVPVDLLILIEKTRTPVAPATDQSTTPVLSKVRQGYPIRSGWWTGCGSWRHLTTGEHAGKFDPAWLQSLTWNELQSLHSDDHERRLKMAYVQRPIAKRVGGHYKWHCDGRSCGWRWMPEVN